MNSRLKKNETACRINGLIINLREVTGKHFILYSTGRPQRFQVMTAKGNKLGNPLPSKYFIDYLESLIAMQSEVSNG